MAVFVPNFRAAAQNHVGTIAIVLDTDSASGTLADTTGKAAQYKRGPLCGLVALPGLQNRFSGGFCLGPSGPGNFGEPGFDGGAHASIFFLDGFGSGL